MAVTITSQVAVSGDDGTWHNNGVGSFSITATLVRIGDSATTDDYNRSAWLRFPNVTIPVGATITAASIEVHAAGLTGAIPQMKIDANAVDNAVAPTTRSGVNAMVHTTASVLWTPPSWTTPTPYSSPNISTVIQEIVNRGGWASGNAIMLFLLDTNVANVLGQISFNAVDGSPVNAAILSVSYNTSTPPTANAGPDQTVGQGVTVALAGSGSTVNGSITNYQWSQVSGTAVTLSSTTTQNPTFTAPGSAGTLVFGLVVTDSASLQSAQDQVTITVGAAPPTANAGPDQTDIDSQTLVTLNATGSTGSPSTYLWRQISGTAVTLSSTSVAQPTFTVPATVNGDTLQFGLKVGDGVIWSNEDTVDISIEPQIEWAIKGGVPVPVSDKVRRGGSWV
jgi:K319-like protein